MSEQFDFESFSRSAIEKLKQGQPLTGTDGVFTPLLKMILEASLESEITDHVQETKQEKNRRNVKGKKTITSGLGSF